jgi:hypothetical protein
VSCPDGFNAYAPDCLNVHHRSSGNWIMLGSCCSLSRLLLRGLEHPLKGGIRVRHIHTAKVHPSFFHTLLQNGNLTKPPEHIITASVESEDLHEAPQEY